MEIMDNEGLPEKGWFGTVKKRTRQINRSIAGVGACFLIPLMLFTSVDVMSRDIFDHPIPGTVELSQYMLAVLILLGLAFAQQIKAHVTISLVTSRLPQCAQLILSIIATLLSLFISCILVWQGWVIGVEEKAVSDMLRVPQYPFRLIVAVAAFLMCLELVIDLGDSLIKLMGKAS
jgi:TRAP-type C4-dicarboxylate transport system permease small subunit